MLTFIPRNLAGCWDLICEAPERALLLTSEYSIGQENTLHTGAPNEIVEVAGPSPSPFWLRGLPKASSFADIGSFSVIAPLPTYPFPNPSRNLPLEDIARPPTPPVSHNVSLTSLMPGSPSERHEAEPGTLRSSLRLSVSGTTAPWATISSSRPMPLSPLFFYTSEDSLLVRKVLVHARSSFSLSVRSS